eukprot:TRINITY_DN41_c0_g1_i2.p1 TRINITY_DN41_c0_g1~~TRINITY_DN41_c0_g1_i2.p1  ORF type:complete len:536 (+),score=134.08 TRINITY_DN41_c0_g1_i2:49-1656(+)
MKAAALLFASLNAANAGQVHLALGMTPEQMSVQWTSENKGSSSEVMYGTSPTSLTMTQVGDIRDFNCTSDRATWYTRAAVMTGLKPNTKYYYKVGDKENGYSDVFSFVNKRSTPPFRHILYGDMGSAAAFTICDACTQHDKVCTATTCAKNTSVGLVSEVDTADMFLHVGDFAYDLDTDKGKLGDQFFENIEQLASRVPYMVSHGNHEDSSQAVAQYIERFRSQPSNAVPPTYKSKNGETTNTMYFSWDHALVHYISISTELWHGVGDGKVTKETLLTWLKDDLIKANKNRDAFPWIVVHGHRPLYSSSVSGYDHEVRAALEDLFFQYGVDFSVNGHQHDYERSFPTYKDKSQTNFTNPTATIYVVTGAAGSHEMHTPFDIKQPSWSAFRSDTFGYSRMIVHNASHIHWQQVQTDPADFPQSDYGRVIDDIWIVQNSHGPFNPANAPTEIPETCDECKTVDHFAPLLNLGPSDVPLYKLIQQYRAEHGELAWAKKLQSVLDKLNGKTGDDAEWEDGLLDKKEKKAFKWIDSKDNQ